MLQQIILPKYNNRLEEQLINLFHESDLPLHFNKTGNKEFTNYQRVSIIILFVRSKKSLRDFIDELAESRWVSYLGLKKIPQKSTLHDWLKIFSMKIIRKYPWRSIDSTTWLNGRRFNKILVEGDIQKVCAKGISVKKRLAHSVKTFVSLAKNDPQYNIIFEEEEFLQC